MPPVAKTKPPKKKSRKPAARPGGRSLRIRMYNVGFGDSFLLFLPTSDGERTMLVDCGAHMSGVANPMSVVTKDIAQTVTSNGRARIDVVVATHRHFDHISGFDQKVWKDVEVGEVWLPWTEQRGNRAADKLRKAQQRLAATLVANFAETTSVGWLALNSLSNAGAERTLLKGFAGAPERRYLPSRTRAKRSFTTPVLPGVTVHALGPSHDPDVIATLDPPKGKFFPMARRLDGGVAGAAEEDPATAAVFADHYRLDTAAYTTKYPELAEHAETAKIDERADADFLGTAAALEDAINGTSLVLILEIDDLCILLAGDAEWGTWSEVLDDTTWRDLLARCTVHKVSHHGSYNGTPKPFVDELLPSDAISLVSLKPIKRWPSIPRAGLLDALESGNRTLVRTDKPSSHDATVRHSDGLWVEIDIPIA